MGNQAAAPAEVEVDVPLSPVVPLLEDFSVSALSLLASELLPLPLALPATLPFRLSVT